MTNPSADMSSNITPWGAMTPGDVERFGQDILDPAARKRWCAAIMFGGLPYLWNESAAAIREELLGELRLRPGAKVLLLGEEVDGIGFHRDIQERIGVAGELAIVDVRERVLKMFFDGKMPQWEYDFTTHYPADYFDAILVGQGVAHAEDWAREGAELIRVLKPGAPLVMAEISFSNLFYARVEADVHIAYWVRKLMEGMDKDFRALPHHDIEDVGRALDGQLDNMVVREWRGCELLWGSKPA